MYLEGVSWDLEKICLIPQHPKELVTDLPLMRVTPIKMNKVRTQNMLKTSIYLTQKRRESGSCRQLTSRQPSTQASGSCRESQSA
jgi:dynein heavy chain